MPVIPKPLDSAIVAASQAHPDWINNLKEGQHCGMMDPAAALTASPTTRHSALATPSANPWIAGIAEAQGPSPSLATCEGHEKYAELMLSDMTPRGADAIRLDCG